MQYNPGDGSGIVDEINALCDSTSTTYTIAEKTRRANIALETLVDKIIGANGDWQFDDRNFSTLPVGTTTMVASQQDYSFDITYLDVLGVEVLDASGIWRKLTPIDLDTIRDQNSAVGEFYKTAGLPAYYDKQGSSILLYPAPAAANVTLTSGLKVFFQRSANLFLTSDTTVVPGIASPFHYLIAYMAALPYCKTYKPQRVPQLQQDIQVGIQNMVNFYSRRSKDQHNVLTMAPINFR